MTGLWRRGSLLLWAALVAYPAAPVVDWICEAWFGYTLRLTYQLVGVVIFAILALALNLQVGYAGLLQLGMAAFFALGAFGAGILTVAKYPFQLGFWGALGTVPLLVGLAGLVLAAPLMRLRGDYLAIVTLGFGEVVRVVLINLESITDGSRGLNPVPPPWVPAYVDATLGPRASFYTLYYIGLLFLFVLLASFRAMEASPMGRALLALRDDELASRCVGISVPRVKLAAFAGGAAVAGLAGVLYATHLSTTAEPNNYDFNTSIMTLCAVILGGLGSPRGVVIAAFLLVGFDNVVAPLMTHGLHAWMPGQTDVVYASFANWRWLIFGGVIVAMMRWRPRGLWPASVATGHT